MPEPAGIAPHTWPIRVYYEDTDAGGIVYHAAYLRYAERARTEMLRTLGLDHGSLARDHGVLFAVRRLEIDYLRSAALDDRLEVRSGVVRVGGASLELVQEIRRGPEPVARLHVRLALLGRGKRAARIPAPLLAALRPGAAGPAGQ